MNFATATTSDQEQHRTKNNIENNIGQSDQQQHRTVKNCKVPANAKASAAMGLNRRCPIDLLQSTEGTELVRTLLQFMDYGVYV